jgi:hypothetical protein
MTWHMVVQMPMLFAGGWYLTGRGVGGAMMRPLGNWNQFGLTGFIAAQLIVAYWMLPLAIDRAVVLPLADLFKLMSLAASGALLHMSVRRSPRVLQLFFVGYAVSMLISTGVFLATTDRRLCNAYSIDSQLNAGAGVAALGIIFGIAWAFQIYRDTLKGPSRTTENTAR